MGQAICVRALAHQHVHAQSNLALQSTSFAMVCFVLLLSLLHLFCILWKTSSR